MADHLAYTTAKRNVKPIEFSIDGEDFHFTPPKKASMVLPIIEQDDVDDMGAMALKQQFDWIERGLPEEEAERLKSRLADDKDNFDTPDMENLLEFLMKQTNGRPTG